MVKSTITGYFHKVSGIRTTCRICKDKPAEGFARFFDEGQYCGKGFVCRDCWETRRGPDDSRYQYIFNEGMSLALIVNETPEGRGHCD